MPSSPNTSFSREILDIIEEEVFKFNHLVALYLTHPLHEWRDHKRVRR